MFVLSNGVSSSYLAPYSGAPQLLVTAAAPTTVAAILFMGPRPPGPSLSDVASTTTMLQSGHPELTIAMSSPVSPAQPGQSAVPTLLTVPSVTTRAKQAFP